MLPRTDLIRWDDEADEPCIQLPSRLDIRLTPWRTGQADEDAAMELFNDVIVAKYSRLRPSPYLRASLAYYAEVVMPSSSRTINSVLRPALCPPASNASAAKPSYPLPSPAPEVPYFPFKVIRQHPSGKLMGDVGLFPHVSSGDTAGGGGGQPAAPQDQAWEIAYNILPEWRGQGIAGEMITTIIESWVSWTGIGRFVARVETANPISARLVQSRGFVNTGASMLDWPEEKGGGYREVGTWEVDMATYQPRLPPASALA